MSKKGELEESITALQDIVRSLQIEERQAENEAAKFQKQRVCGNKCSRWHSMLQTYKLYFNVNWVWFDMQFLYLCGTT